MRRPLRKKEKKYEVSNFTPHQWTGSLNLHDGPATHGDDNHHQPARDLGETVADIAKRNKQAMTGKEAVEWMHESIDGPALLPCLLGVDFIDCLWVDSGGVHANSLDGCFRSNIRVGRIEGRNLEMPDVRRAGQPSRAEKSFLLAV